MRRTAVGWDHVGQTRGKMGMGRPMATRWGREPWKQRRVGGERVEAGADGGGRMRRILVELETRLVFQERVQGGGWAKDYRTKRSFAGFHGACLLRRL